MFLASTPVESFWEVVKTVGIVFSLSWKSSKYPSPRLPSLAVTLTQYFTLLLSLSWLTKSLTAAACSWFAQKIIVFSFWLALLRNILTRFLSLALISMTLLKSVSTYFLPWSVLLLKLHRLMYRYNHPKWYW